MPIDFSHADAHRAVRVGMLEDLRRTRWSLIAFTCLALVGGLLVLVGQTVAGDIPGAGSAGGAMAATAPPEAASIAVVAHWVGVALVLLGATAAVAVVVHRVGIRARARRRREDLEHMADAGELLRHEAGAHGEV
ncbi:hypothetical protein [Cellulomonas sp. Y8]|uniref:hypothetical protein n=1 Tax=Cellulomonas sp. Y8 TaxID=2591145 RepID=UPI003D70A51D